MMRASLCLIYGTESVFHNGIPPVDSFERHASKRFDEITWDYTPISVPSIYVQCSDIANGQNRIAQVGIHLGTYVSMQSTDTDILTQWMNRRYRRRTEFCHSAKQVRAPLPAIRCKRNRRLRKKRANFVLNLCTHNRKVVLTEAPEGSIKRIWMATIR